MEKVPILAVMFSQIISYFVSTTSSKRCLVLYEANLRQNILCMKKFGTCFQAKPGLQTFSSHPLILGVICIGNHGTF